MNHQLQDKGKSVTLAKVFNYKHICHSREKVSPITPPMSQPIRHITIPLHQRLVLTNLELLRCLCQSAPTKKNYKVSMETYQGAHVCFEVWCQQNPNMGTFPMTAWQSYADVVREFVQGRDKLVMWG